eukprot:gene405-6819_t
MLLTIFLLVIVVILLYLASFFLKPYYLIRSSYNVETGKRPKVFNFFYFFYLAVFHSRAALDEFTKENAFPQKMYCVALLNRLSFITTTAESAKQILGDNKTFQKQTQRITGHSKTFLGSDHVVGKNGDDWKRQRQAMNPAFYDLELYSDTFSDKAHKVIEKMITQSKDGIVENISDYMQKMTLDILGKAIFDHDFESIDSSSQKELESYNFIVDNIFSMKYLFFNLLFSDIPIAYNIKMKESIKKMDDLVSSLVDKSIKRMKKKGSMDSMLDFMVDAHLNPDSDNQMSLKELRDNIIIFFLAGHETTANALSYILLLLGKNQDVQDKARETVMNVMKNEKPCYKNTKDLDYLLYIIKEGMRMFNPVEQIPERITTKDIILDGFFIPKGSAVGINITAIHNNKTIYGDPENFRPNRWSPEEQEKRKIPSSAWLPFSAGARVCIGNNFSIIEQKIFLSEILKKYKVTLPDPNAKIEKDPSKFFLKRSKGNPAQVLEKISVPLPSLQPKDILVKNIAASVNSVDSKQLTSHEDFKNPLIVGFDGVGKVAAVGKETSIYKVGDKVKYADSISRQGTYAKYSAVDERIVGKVPETWNDAEIATLPLVGLTAYERIWIDVVGKLLKPRGSFVSIVPSKDGDIKLEGDYFVKRLTVSMELMFSKSIFGYELESQKEILDKLADLADSGVLKSTMNKSLKFEDVIKENEEVLAGKAIGK